MMLIDPVEPMGLALAFVLVTLAVVQIIAFLAIMYRHAIPRAPGLFHALLVAPMIASVASALVMAGIAVGDAGTAFGLPGDLYLIVFFASEAATFSILNAYAFFHYVKNKHRAES